MTSWPVTSLPGALLFRGSSCGPAPCEPALRLPWPLALPKSQVGVRTPQGGRCGEQPSQSEGLFCPCLSSRWHSSCNAQATSLVGTESHPLSQGQSELMFTGASHGLPTLPSEIRGARGAGPAEFRGCLLYLEGGGMGSWSSAMGLGLAHLSTQFVPFGFCNPGALWGMSSWPQRMRYGLCLHPFLW